MDLVKEVKFQSSQGVSKDNLYVISHDGNHTKRIAGEINANEIVELSTILMFVFMAQKMNYEIDS